VHENEQMAGAEGKRGLKPKENREGKRMPGHGCFCLLESDRYLLYW